MHQYVHFYFILSPVSDPLSVLQDANVVIAQTYEYRHLPAAQIEGSDLLDRSNSDVMSRYLGLVVIPGEHIIKLEVEEFASQMRNKDAII